MQNNKGSFCLKRQTLRYQCLWEYYKINKTGEDQFEGRALKIVGQLPYIDEYRSSVNSWVVDVKADLRIITKYCKRIHII